MKVWEALFYMIRKKQGDKKFEVLNFTVTILEHSGIVTDKNRSGSERANLQIQRWL